MDVFKIMEKYAEEFNFPVLDNYYFDLAHIRISVFKNKHHSTCILFETLGIGNDGPENTLYIYSDICEENGLVGVAKDKVCLNFKNGEENPFNFTIGEIEYRYHLTEDDYNEKNIQNPRDITDILRFLKEENYERLLLSEQESQKFVEKMTNEYGFKLFYKTDEWQHPDLSGGEKLMDSPFFKSLKKATALNDLTKIKLGKPNTHWSNWTWSDFKNQ